MIEAFAIATLNILSIVVFTKTRNLRKRSMYLVINLAVADTFVGGFAVALDFFHTGVFCNYWQYNLPDFGLWASEIHALAHTFELTSIINLAVISLERLHATFRPFKHRLVKKWVFGVSVGVIWVTAAISSTTYEVLLILEHESVRVVSIHVSPLLFLSISLFIIIVSYVSIVVKIRCGAHPQHHGAASRERKLTNTLFIVTLMLVLPEVIFVNLRWFQDIDSSVDSLSPPTFLQLAFALQFLRYGNSLINPLLYTYRMPEFKRALVSLLRCRSHPIAVQDFPLGVM